MPFSPADFPLDAKTAVRIVTGAFLLPHTIAKLSNVDRACFEQSQIGFVDQAGCIQQGELAAAPKLGVRQLPQVLIKQIEQQLQRSVVAAA